MSEDPVIPESLERIADWVLLPESADDTWGKSDVYMLVWVGDDPPPTQVQNACLFLQNDPLAFTSFTVGAVQTPSFGLIINTKTGLGFEDSLRAKATLEKIIWEIERISDRYPNES